MATCITWVSGIVLIQTFTRQKNKNWTFSVYYKTEQVRAECSLSVFSIHQVYLQSAMDVWIGQPHRLPLYALLLTLRDVLIHWSLFSVWGFSELYPPPLRLFFWGLRDPYTLFIIASPLYLARSLPLSPFLWSTVCQGELNCLCFTSTHSAGTFSTPILSFWHGLLQRPLTGLRVCIYVWVCLVFVYLCE